VPPSAERGRREARVVSALQGTWPVLTTAIIGPEPTPEFAAQMGEEYERLLGLLGSEQLRQMAVAKMEGYTIEEMAARFDCAPATIVRKLQKIRETWDRELPP
jgi:DNA-directed RNA polymerase specialized sigma24 family protein